MALLGWVAGCTAIWSALFCVGNFLYHRYTQAGLLAVVFTISGLFLVYATRALWVEMPKAGKG